MDSTRANVTCIINLRISPVVFQGERLRSLLPFWKYNILNFRTSGGYLGEFSDSPNKYQCQKGSWWIRDMFYWYLFQYWWQVNQSSTPLRCWWLICHIMTNIKCILKVSIWNLCYKHDVAKIIMDKMTCWLQI